jgi:flagellar assembly protein FliH
MNAAKFIFETDFRGDSRGRRISDVDVSTAREDGFAQGFAEGQQAARAESQAALTHMAGVLAQQAERLLAGEDRRREDIEAATAALAVTIARRLAGAALADRPQALIEQAARECIVHARSAPHLAVRVNDAEVDSAEQLFGRLAHESGYAGKVIVLGEPDIASGDARIEWADGGVVIDRAGLEEAMAAAAARVLGPRADQEQG